MTKRNHSQNGGFAIGLVVGMLAGLLVALAVAWYVNQVPVPFVNKLPQRTAEQDAAEIERNRTWDPNAALGPKAPTRPAAPPAPAAAPGVAAAPMKAPPSPAMTTAAPAPRPAALAASAPPKVLKPGADPFTYYAQAGAYSRAEDAQAQRAKLALMGLDARIVEREQAGRTVYRVRLGPYEKRPEVEAMLERLTSASVESTLVRVERQ